MKEVFFCFLFLINSIIALSPLSTNDGLSMTFTGSGHAGIDGLAIDGTSLKGGDISELKGGFSALFYGEDSIGATGPNLIFDGDFNTNTTKWAKQGTGWVWDSTGGRGGSGALKLSAGGIAVNGGHIPANATALKISGWSKAENSNGNRDNQYSLYIDLQYADNSWTWAAVDCGFEVGTHDYVYMSKFLQLEKPAKFCYYVLCYRGSHTIGNVWFDDVALQTYSQPSLSTGSITALSSTVYQQISQDCNTKLVANFTSHSSFIQVDARMEDISTVAKNRFVTLALSLPVNAIGWTWASGMDSKLLSNSTIGAKSSTTTNYGPHKSDCYLVASISNGDIGLAIGIVPNIIVPFRFQYSPISQLLSISTDFALTQDYRDSRAASVSFVIFKNDYPSVKWSWRAAHSKFCKKVLPDPYTTRVILDQGLWLPGDDFSTVANAEDFNPKFFDGAWGSKWMDTHGVKNFYYVEPVMQHLEFSGTTSSELQTYLNTCNTKGCNVSKTSYITDRNGGICFDEENAAWNVGIKLPLNSNILETGANPYGQAMISWIEKYFQTGKTWNFNISGVFYDSIEVYTGSLDYRKDHMAISLSPPLFDSDLKPVILNGQSTFDFTHQLALYMRKYHPDSSLIMCNWVFFAFPQFASWIDLFGSETTWLVGTTYTPKSHKYMFYRRAQANQKQFAWVQNSDWNVWTYSMTEKYFQSSLLYGIMPGFFSANAADDRYWSNSANYERDRPLFKKYMPLFKAITKRGWQSVTCLTFTTTGAGASFYAERWGDEFPYLFTARMETESGSSMPATGTIDLSCLGIASATDIKVVEIGQTSGKVVGSDSFTMTFSSETTYVFNITNEKYIPKSDADDTNTSEISKILPSLLLLFFAVMMLN